MAAPAFPAPGESGRLAAAGQAGPGGPGGARADPDGAGIVVPVGDAEAFAAALKKLADNPALRQRMGAAGRQQVLERHTWPASAEKLAHLYRDLVGRHG